jgi:hypothetical protein
MIHCPCSRHFCLEDSSWGVVYAVLEAFHKMSEKAHFETMCRMHVDVLQTIRMAESDLRF